MLINSRPIAEPWLVDNVDALIEAWEPGALGGQALAEIIFGEVNPGGKLQCEFTQCGPFTSDLPIKPSAYVRRYVDAPTKDLFEFGDGLSYTQFTYSKPALSTSRIAENELPLSVTVTNDGDRDGDKLFSFIYAIIFRGWRDRLRN